MRIRMTCREGVLWCCTCVFFLYGIDVQAGNELHLRGLSARSWDTKEIPHQIQSISESLESATRPRMAATKQMGSTSFGRSLCNNGGGP